MSLFNNWEQDLQPLIAQYKGRKHPLAYQNLYQLLVMVVLSAQDSDANINKIAPLLFEIYPNIEELSYASIDQLMPHISKVKNYPTKASWLIEIAQTIKKDDNIPKTMDSLIALKGIGRKSANVMMREQGIDAKGIIVDLHVIRVAPRIGLVNEANDGNKIEKQLMEMLTYHIWNDIGMSLSFLGREICRPTNPKCNECVMNKSCNYYNNQKL
jgi:endonuclease III